MRTRIKTFALALLFAVCTASAVGQTTATATKTVNITISAYISVAFNNNTAMSFSIADGGHAHSYAQTASFNILSNVPYTVSSAVIAPKNAGGSLTAPGSFASATTLDGVTQSPTNGTGGLLTVTISGLDYATATKGTYANGGSTTITVIDAS